MNPMPFNPFSKFAEWFESKMEAAMDGTWNMTLLAKGQQKLNGAVRAYFAAKKELASMSYEAIDAVKQLPTGGDTDKEKIRVACLEDIADLNAVLNQVMSGRLAPEEGVHKISEIPFGQESLGTNSNGKLKAISHSEPSPEGQPAVPVKRGRGRPKGSKTKRPSPAETNGQPHDGEAGK
jgi:hypothetical protein